MVNETFNKQKPIGRSISAMPIYRTFAEIEEEYLRRHPEEIDDYIPILFDEYAESGDTASLLRSLRVVDRVKNITTARLRTAILRFDRT
jgi:hypothetical protein